MSNRRFAPEFKEGTVRQELGMTPCLRGPLFFPSEAGRVSPLRLGSNSIFYHQSEG
jgi:hypothetical protein